MSNFPPVFDSSRLTQEPIRKQLQFSLLNAQDTVKISEFQVTHRDLYTPTDRLPVKDGVLDRRLVSCPHLPIHNALISISGNDREECILRDLRPQFCGLRWPLCIYQTGGPSIPHRLLQAYHCHPSGHMQSKLLDFSCLSCSMTR